MNLVKLTVDYWNLLRSLSKKVISVTSANFYLAIVLFLFSQLFQILAFFLPLKVLILLGSDGIPRYLQGFVNKGNKEEFIVWLALAAIIFYILFLFCNYFVSRLTKASIHNILAKAKKYTVVSNQELLAENVFQKLVQSWGTYFMLLSGFIVGYFIEWRVFIVLSLALIFEYTMFSILLEKYRKPNNLLRRNRFLINRNIILSSVSAVNFFIGFCALFFVFFTDDTVNMFVGILLILLIRQVSQRLMLAVNDAIFLHKNKSNIKAIYYTKGVLDETNNHISESFENLLSYPNRELFLNEIFSSIEHPKLSYDQFWQWVDLGQQNIALFEHTIQDISDVCRIKVFASNKKIVYQKELFFFETYQNFDNELPKLKLSGEYLGVYYFITIGKALFSINISELKKIKSREVFRQWQILPSKDTKSVLERSLPSLSDRISSNRLKCIALAIDHEDEEQQFIKFLNKIDKISHYIKHVPMCFINQDLSINNLRIDSFGNTSCISWNKIALEPICSNINIGQIERIFNLEQTLEELKIVRDDLAHITVEGLKLTILMSGLDKMTKKKNYKAALKLVPQIIELSDEVCL